MTSAKQVAANRKNAEKSSGPRTDAGKDRSSRNATTHGVYAGPQPILSGVFEEDPDEIIDFTIEIMMALAPRNRLELAAARRVARAALQAQRLDRYAACETARTSRVTTHDEERRSRVTEGLDLSDEELVSERVLYRTMERITDLDARVGREYVRALDGYRKVRELVDATSLDEVA